MIVRDLGNIYNPLGEEAVRFIEKYVKVRSSFKYENGRFVAVDGKQLVPFRLTPKQMEFVYVFTHPNTAGVVLKKPRQIGMTTLICALALFYAYKFEHYNVYIISIKLEDAQFVVNTIMNIVEGIMESGEKIKVVTSSEYKHLKKLRKVKSITLANGSVIYPLTTTVTAGSGLTSGMIILDEFAKNPYAQEIYQSSIPALSTVKNSKFAIISTPFKLRSGEYYEEFFVDAYFNDLQTIKTFGGLGKVPDRVVVPIEVQWWEAPNRDNEKFFTDPANFTPDITKNRWIKEQIAKLTKGISDEQEKREILNQELWGEFVFHDSRLVKKNVTTILEAGQINPEILERIRVRNAELRSGGQVIEDGGLTIFHPPKEGGVYFMFVDWASGLRSDDAHAHAFVVWQVVNGDRVVARAVAEYRGVVPGNMFLDIIKEVSKKYNAVVIPELNSIGRLYAELLEQTHPLMLSDTIVIGKETIVRKGINLSKDTRNTAIRTFLGVGLEGGGAEVYSFKLIDELSNFNVKEGVYKFVGRPQPIKDKNGIVVDILNDDLLIFPYSVGFTTIYLNLKDDLLHPKDRFYIPSIRRYVGYRSEVESVDRSVKEAKKQSFEELLWRGLLNPQPATENEIDLILRLF